MFHCSLLSILTAKASIRCSAFRETQSCTPIHSLHYQASGAVLTSALCILLYVQLIANNLLTILAAVGTGATLLATASHSCSLG